MIDSIGIIGTAGRKSASRFMTKEYWDAMKSTCEKLLCDFQVEKAVSGGAAFSDHLAVTSYLSGHASNLLLHFPAPFSLIDRRYVSGHYGNITNELHEKFSTSVGINSLEEIAQALEHGADYTVNPGGFLHRNTDIVKTSKGLIAFTSGMFDAISDYGVDHSVPDNVISDNGTRDTWSKAKGHYRIRVSIPALVTKDQFSLF